MAKDIDAYFPANKPSTEPKYEETKLWWRLDANNTVVPQEINGPNLLKIWCWCEVFTYIWIMENLYRFFAKSFHHELEPAVGAGYGGYNENGIPFHGSYSPCHGRPIQDWGS